jgi:3-oxoacyl-[acyl-carrier-protein] synthase II
VGEIFEALCAGRSGLGGLGGFDTARFRAQQAYEIDDRAGLGSDTPGRATRWLGRAVKAALQDARVGMDLRDVPVLVGTGLRELRSLELWWRDGCELDVRDLHFGTALRSQFQAATTYTFSNACSASLCALGLAADVLALEAAEAVVVAGVDSITESMFGLLDRVQPEPPEAVRPFDHARKGVLMGEGAAAVVLRPAADGVGAGRGHALLRSVGMSCDAYHVTAPDVKGIMAAIHDAHARAGLGPDDIDLILLHGTGTLRNDEAEASAVHEIFAGTGASPLMTAIKSMTGHTSGGSGLLSLIIGVECLKTGRIPPTIGLVQPVNEAAGFRFVRGVQTTADLALVQVNAFGFGGVNAVAILQRMASDGLC